MGIYIIVLLYLLIIIYGLKINGASTYFMSKDYSICMKGILSIIIIFTHLWRGNGDNIFINVFHSFGYIAVSMFFLLSGYGLKHQVNENKEYLKGFLTRRLISIYIPYVLAMFVSLTIFGIDNGWNEITTEKLLRLFSGLDAIWFIKAIVIFYVAFFIVYRFLPKNKFICITLIVLIEMGVTCFTGMNKQWYGSSLGFIIGIYLADHINELKSKKNKIIPIVIFAFSSCFFEYIYAQNKDNLVFGNLIIRNLLCVSILCFILLVTKWIKVQNPILKFLGTISYEVFLIHSCIIEIVYKKLYMLNFSLQLVIIIVSTILIAFLLHLLDSRLLKCITRKLEKPKEN